MKIIKNPNEETDPTNETENPDHADPLNYQIIDWGYRQVLAGEAKEHGWTGKGVKVGIIDTGSEPTIPI